MKFAAALTAKQDWTEAVEDLVRQVRASLGPAKIDILFLHVHPQFVPDLPKFAEALRANLGPGHVLGCTGGGVIGDRQEIENQPAIALLAGELPGVQVRPFHITQEELDGAAGPEYWHFQLEVDPQENPNFVLLADPFSLQIIQLVGELNEAYPARPLVGGLSSGGQQAGENRLLLDDQVLEDGAVGVSLSGNIRLHTIVSTGCRPIGEPLVVTRADKNIVLELGGRPPIKVLEELVPQLPPRDQQLARTALVLGQVIDEYKEEFRLGDFLIRNLIGHDPHSGALAVGDVVRPGQTVQFQVRDGQAADEELRHCLTAKKEELGKCPPRGALLFSCLGRGEGMYGVPHHDVTALHHVFGALPTAGFFGNGEIGPVGDRTYLHGFTSVIGLFSEP